ncbi:acetolactate synthase small subunit [Corynebacterium lipophiloflavum]|uniref:Acetolactate synthase small subunit n=1 Tax=Corynebacterium lipophiloflavum (strain ATCC 700352 / DSM 44291 / CCUG 37336 / JCM 10383 / DMMZ 1944) TaxID=525263 RepID=C0XPK2_CORLD|nr:acetolactate synthase small subunit [Corynebacterium lipophiloflavum]EEI17820.1 acetolactate synthase, small subunit [Corynebacterium lipophiloflavum DSM 44291]
MNKEETNRHILSVLVLDLDGIITRVTALFTRRGYSLVSLVSANTETEGVNRLTIVVDASEYHIEQITKQLNKLIQVLKVTRLDDANTIARSLLLVKVNADNSNRPQVVDAANIFRARVVDVAPESVVIEATGTPSKLRAFLDVMETFGIRELVSSGQVALNRGPKAMGTSK